MDKIKIFVDVDNTINDFSLHFEQQAQKAGFALDIAGRTVFNLKSYFSNKSSKEKTRMIDKILSEDLFWQTIPIKPGAAEILKNLYTNPKYDIWVATALWAGNPNNKENKYKWIARYLSFFDKQKILFESEKWKLDGDIMIDDKPTTLEKWNGVAIAFDYPYNHNVTVDYRVTSWKEIAEILD